MSSFKFKFGKFIFLAPSVIFVMALIIYPMFYGMGLSFFRTNLINRWDFTGFLNYKNVFKNEYFMSSIAITLKFTFIVVAGHFLIGMFFALLLNKNIKNRAIFRSILMIPWLFPEVVFGVLWKLIMSPTYGIFNYMLMKIGILSEPISWFGSVEHAFNSLCLISIWKGFPFVMLMILAGLQSIPSELYEAGELDGCNAWNSLRYITIPSIMPVITVSLILDTVNWFRQYDLVSILTSGGPNNSTMLISRFIYDKAFQSFDYGEASAMAVIVFIICCVIGFIYRKMTTVSSQ